MLFYAVTISMVVIQEYTWTEKKLRPAPSRLANTRLANI